MPRTANTPTKFRDVGRRDTVLRCRHLTERLGQPLAPGFASSSIRAMNPDRGELDDAEHARNDAALGHPIRLVYMHH